MAGIGEKTRNFIAESRRVLMVTRKPSWKEYKMASKITGLGMILIGTIGLIITMLAYLILGTQG
ncbi:protein translocase SEC61 complex subunit gamma [Thermococcus sp.]|uniref:protein translocase SEC61 complex subunit gamma n=1 Tax=Thermococcus sp. TaxID=35749 RepID=UPI002629FA97|nr:protein translocase SEC61 complex subunit gamma [Thermococcus sp.]